MSAAQSTATRILAATKTLTGLFTASDIAKVTGLSVSNVASWMLHNAAGHNIKLVQTAPRRYSHDNPASRLSLQQALGYQLPTIRQPSQQISERHPSGRSYGVVHGGGHSSAFLAMTEF